ncbi:MAG: protein kinase, partial [Pirellulaceae bacterium]|nr:protein kinase [Pirellulaceae bacterium]
MSDEVYLSELLLRWEKLRDQGESVSLAELCHETPELLPLLRLQVERLGHPGEFPSPRSLRERSASDTKQPADPNQTQTLDPYKTIAPAGGLAGPPVPLASSSGTKISVPGFEILGELGRGGMGVVLRARDLELDRDVAVKILRQTSDGSSDGTLRFVEEAHITGQLQHPGIAPVYRLGRLPDQTPFFAMKLIKGRTLADLLEERKEPGQDRSRFLKVFEQICQTLAYAHSRRV